MRRYQIPDYTLLKKCGRGAYGDVWVAVVMKITMKNQSAFDSRSGIG